MGQSERSTGRQSKNMYTSDRIFFYVTEKSKDLGLLKKSTVPDSTSLNHCLQNSHQYLTIHTEKPV